MKLFDEADDETMKELISGGIGTCTSFAISVAQGSLHQYTIGDTGNHRVAWTEDGIVVDSSARGIIQLKENIPYRCRKGSIKYLMNKNDDGTMTIEHAVGKETLQPIEKLSSEREGMKRSFRQAILRVNDRAVSDEKEKHKRIQWHDCMEEINLQNDMIRECKRMEPLLDGNF